MQRLSYHEPRKNLLTKIVKFRKVHDEKMSITILEQLFPYLIHMLKTQKLMVDEFGVEARNNDMLGSMSDLAAKLGGSGYAEND